MGVFFYSAELCGALSLEASPGTVWAVALLAIGMMAGAWWLSRYRKKGRISRGAIACAAISVMLHIALVAILPYTVRPGGGPPGDELSSEGKDAQSHLATLSAIELVDSASEQSEAEDARKIAPLPTSISAAEQESTLSSEIDIAAMVAESAPTIDIEATLPPATSINEMADTSDLESVLEPWMSDIVSESMVAEAAVMPQQESHEVRGSTEPDPPSISDNAENDGMTPPTSIAGMAPQRAPEGRVLGEQTSEFANRYGSAKQEALRIGGGDQETEAAVAAGLQFLATYQRPDGSWDPLASGAGVERSVLGQHRSGAGARATTGISGLALLSMLGSGSTHHSGDHSQPLLMGLQYLINVQRPDGSLAAEADHFAKTYCHGMAAIALCETAALTQDAVAIDTARAAVGFTLRSQHPSTGGWRYVAGDTGDMSQLGWQAMVISSARGAGIEVPPDAIVRVERFLRSVRAGKTGGLASYKPGDAPSRTMTAEALAIRLMFGEQVPPNEISEAEAFLLEELPGVGPDNFYYWYYASLALHQLQRPSWQTWNEAMKSRLLELQAPDGSWPTNTVWGGHGGKVYTTAMACLCLEVYYRHLTVDERGTVQTATNSEFMRR